MRVVVVGTGGLGQIIAYSIAKYTNHQLLLLSRSEQPELVAQGYQVMAVNYAHHANLCFALTGVDVVISTAPGTVQLQIIEAALAAGVRRYAPAEFEGPPTARVQGRDPLDGGKAAVLAFLARHQDRLESTAFICGILYERFSPSGTQTLTSGQNTHIAGEGRYLVDVRNMRARIPLNSMSSEHVAICMTSAHDVGRFVAHALDLPQWPAELTMLGERLTTYGLLKTIERVRGIQFRSNITYESSSTLHTKAQMAQASGDTAELYRVLELQATATGRYDYPAGTLNSMFPNIIPSCFEDWLRQAWQGQ